MPKVDFAYKKVQDARMPRLPLSRREAAAARPRCRQGAAGE